MSLVSQWDNPSLEKIAELQKAYCADARREWRVAVDLYLELDLWLPAAAIVQDCVRFGLPSLAKELQEKIRKRYPRAVNKESPAP